MGKPMRWAVIENAGYEGECVIASNFTHWLDAYDYVCSHYDEDERESLHVDVAHWDEEGEFWSYDH